MPDVRCSICGSLKPDIAYPQSHGQRVGRQCRACLCERRRHKQTNAPTGRAVHQEALRRFVCPACERRYPYVYPHESRSYGDIPEGTMCRGCTCKDRARRKKEGVAA